MIWSRQQHLGFDMILPAKAMCLLQITSLRMIPTMAYIATYSTALERNI